MHADITSEILKNVGYGDDFIEHVSFLINKKLIKKNEESQILEDVICLVFLAFYFEEFADKHTEDKVIDILKKTWLKMSEKGHTEALKINFSKKSLALINQVLS